eukprot:GDKI01042319.1.p2 GENE.GDKI01042319.1~~GDKI01042319.1.p2  ORF type:complete len:139 (-),score=22.05 GDKI01042319.1:20-436(-)
MVGGFFVCLLCAFGIKSMFIYRVNVNLCVCVVCLCLFLWTNVHFIVFARMNTCVRRATVRASTHHALVSIRPPTQLPPSIPFVEFACVHVYGLDMHAYMLRVYVCNQMVLSFFTVRLNCVHQAFMWFTCQKKTDKQTS